MPDNTALTLLDNIGLDRICTLIESGQSLREIARGLDIDPTRVVEWFHALDAQQSARVTQSRARAASAWDELAMEALQSIPDDATPGQIARAREIASHYRWRASKLARSTYGDAVQVEVTHTSIDLAAILRDARKRALPATQPGITLDHDGNSDQGGWGADSAGDEM